MAIAAVMACTSNHAGTGDANDAQAQTYDVMVTDQDNACVSLGYGSFAQTIVTDAGAITVTDEHTSMLGPIAASDVMVAGASLTFTVMWTTDAASATENYTLAFVSGELVGTMAAHFIVGSSQCQSKFSVSSS